MDAELEALVKALDAFLQAKGTEASQLETVDESKLEEVLARKASLSRESLKRAVIFAYNGWRASQDKFPTMPPKA